MRKAASLEDQARLTVCRIEFVIAGKGIGLQNAGPRRQMRLGMFTAPVA